MTNDNSLEHYGVLRRSGRYPWGSGDNPKQSHTDFLGLVDELRSQGLTEAEIAKSMDMTTTQLRARKSAAKNDLRKERTAQALRLKETGMSNVAIAKEMGLSSESAVRALLSPSEKQLEDSLTTTANFLRDQVGEKKYLDVGAGTENYIGVAPTKLKTAVAMLEDEGYTTHYVKVEQLGTGKYTTIKVLAPPGTTYSEVFKNQEHIRPVAGYSEDDGKTFLGIEPPTQINSSRIAVRYGDEGGNEADGVIYVRPGVDDIALGGKRYAQVRIAVDGSHYLKGMAVYSDDLPPGVDLMFNTNKSDTGNKLDALKKVSEDTDNPFGATVRQRHYVDSDGNRQLSAMNIVNEEGDWYKWSKTLSSQMLSKQSADLAKERLETTFENMRAEYDEITALTNPTVRRRLLESYADKADSAAVHLKAAGLPRTRNHVILPIPDMKEGEVFAPHYRDGERVVLIRHPHGGRFEIPELTVNNRVRSARKALGADAPDAIGINPKVAGILSGADFDGDTVLVIPNNARRIKTAPPLAGLKDFDAKKMYPHYEGMKVMSPAGTQHAMGDISNLITDMTIKGATQSEISRAVRHSMVVIDAEKHKLDYRRSARDNNIADLKKKYQGGPRAGAQTLISRAGKEVRVPERRERRFSEGGPIDPATGKKVFVDTGASWVDAQGRTHYKKTRLPEMASVDDARALSSGRPVEETYAKYANRMKALANQARKEAFNTPPIRQSPSAKKTYAKEVSELDTALDLAARNRPLERRAQLVANAIVKAKRQDNPNMTTDTLKKVRGQALTAARERTGAERYRIVLTDAQWEAIQAGAVSNNKLSAILQSADLDRVRQLATPRTNTVMTASTLRRAKTLAAAGHTPSEIADALGVATSTLADALKREES